MFNAATYRELGLSRTGRRKAKRRSVAEFLKGRQLPLFPRLVGWERWEHIAWDAAAVERVRRYYPNDMELLLDEAGFQAYRRGLGGNALETTLALIMPAFTDAEANQAREAIIRGYEHGRRKLKQARAPDGVTWEARRQLRELAAHLAANYPRYWNATAMEVAKVMATSASHASRLLKLHRLTSGKIRIQKTSRGSVRQYHIRSWDVLALNDRLEGRGRPAPAEKAKTLTGRARALVEWARRVGGDAESTARRHLDRLGYSKPIVEASFAASSRAPP